MSQLRQQQNRLDSLNIDVRLIAFDSDILARAYAKETKLAWPILLDGDRELYSAYGMSRGSWWDIANPVAIYKYVRVMLRGNRVGKPGRDYLQMGGDVLIDPSGIVRLHFTSDNPHDRPEVSEILQVVVETIKEKSSRSTGD